VRTTSDAEDESTLVAIGSGASCRADDSWDAGRVMSSVKGNEESVLVGGGDGGGEESAPIMLVLVVRDQSVVVWAMKRTG